MPLMGQRHALGVAIEQPHADLGFQLLDRQRQRRLGDKHRRAPAEIDPVSATAMKWRIWRNVIIPIAFQAAALLSAFYYVAHP